MKLMDTVWEFIDNAAYIMTILACLLLAFACVVVPCLLAAIRADIRELISVIEKKTVVVECHHERLPLPHVFPRLRKFGEESEE